MGIIKFTKVEQASCLFYKIINNLTPEYTRDPIPPLHQSQYCFRDQDVIGRTRARTETFESSFYPDCLSEWNQLDPEMRLGWPTIQELIESETAKVVYKALHNEAPDYLKGLFHRLSDTQSRMLRNSNTDLRIPLFKTSSGQKSFEFRGALIWNNLSNEAKQASTFLAFKHKL